MLPNLLNRQSNGRIAKERTPPHNHLIQQHAERINIHRRGDRFSLQLFRSHVGGRSNNRHGGFGYLRQRISQPEIRHNRFRTVLGKNHVGGLKITMHHVLLMRGGKGCGYLPYNGQRFPRLQRTATLKRYRQRLALHQLHREERDHALRLRFVMAVQIENAAHVRMRHRARKLDLAFESRQCVLIAHPHCLYGHPGAKLQVLGLVYFAHAPGSDRPHNAIPARQNLTRLKHPRQYRRGHQLVAQQAHIQQTVRLAFGTQHKQYFVA